MIHSALVEVSGHVQPVAFLVFPDCGFYSRPHYAIDCAIIKPPVLERTLGPLQMASKLRVVLNRFVID